MPTRELRPERRASKLMIIIIKIIVNIFINSFSFRWRAGGARAGGNDGQHDDNAISHGGGTHENATAAPRGKLASAAFKGWMG